MHYQALKQRLARAERVNRWKAQALIAPLAIFLLLVFLVPTTLLFHGDVADKLERIQLFKNLAIMGGLLVATVLTLLFLPALYAAWFRVKPAKA